MAIQADSCRFEEPSKSGLGQSVSRNEVREHALLWIKLIEGDPVTSTCRLRWLARSTEPELRIAVADHINTPQEVIVVLAGDSDPNVRLAIAENHNVALHLLTKLFNDPNPYVANRASKTLARLGFSPHLMRWDSHGRAQEDT